MNRAISGVKVVPGATIAVPSASPSGRSPAGTLENSVVQLLLAHLHELLDIIGHDVPLIVGDWVAASSRITSAAFSPTM